MSLWFGQRKRLDILTSGLGGTAFCNSFTFAKDKNDGTHVFFRCKAQLLPVHPLCVCSIGPIHPRKFLWSNQMELSRDWLRCIQMAGKHAAFISQAHKGKAPLSCNVYRYSIQGITNYQGPPTLCSSYCRVIPKLTCRVDNGHKLKAFVISQKILRNYKLCLYGNFFYVKLSFLYDCITQNVHLTKIFAFYELCYSTS